MCCIWTSIEIEGLYGETIISIVAKYVAIGIVTCAHNNVDGIKRDVFR